jgi:thioredoxin
MMKMNQKAFEEQVLNGNKPVLVEFWAPWCVYCRRIAPALQKLSQQQENLIIGQVNIDEEPLLANQEHIEVIPTFVLYENGQALGSIVAPESKARIEEFIRETLGY